MKEVKALLLLEWEGKGHGGGSRRFVLKILHDGGRGLVELGFYENLASHVEDPVARGEVRGSLSVYVGGSIRARAATKNKKTFCDHVGTGQEPDSCTTRKPYPELQFAILPMRGF